jgi:hypothetical protein
MHRLGQKGVGTNELIQVQHLVLFKRIEKHVRAQGADNLDCLFQADSARLKRL